MAFCPNCGAEISNGAKFCMSCGAPVPEQKKAEDEGSSAQNSTASSYTSSSYSNTKAYHADGNKNLKPCKKCGQLVAKNAKKCPHCGAKLKHTGLIIVLVIVGIILLSSIGKSKSSSSVSTPSTGAAESSSSSSSIGTASKGGDVKFEITDVIESNDDSYFGNGKSFNVIVEVTNTGNVPMYLDNCVLDFEDKDGHLLQTYDFMSKVPDVVEPGEKGYFYTNGNSSFDEGVSLDNGYNLVPTVTVVKAKGTVDRHEVVDASIYNNDYGSVGIKGRIVNNTNEEVSLIYVTTVFYGKDGKVLGISGTNVTDIAANAKTSFDDSGIFMRGFTIDDVADYKVYADEMYLQF